MIQTNGDDDHSVSVSPSIKSLQGTTHHLTVHSVKQDGKYQCQVFTIKDGSVADQLTHQVTISKGMLMPSSRLYVDNAFYCTLETSLLATLTKLV